jgi:hypothetical protein
MPTISNYTVIQDGDVTLGEADDFQFDFDAPDLTTSTSNADRPMLVFKINPHDDDARLEIVLNNNRIYLQTFSAGPIRSLNEVFSHGQLLPTANRMIVGNRLTGEFTVSDFAVWYKADI